MGDLAAHRASTTSSISTANVGDLAPSWSFDIKATGPFGAVTAAPIVVGDLVYLQDMQSNVFALDRATGQVLWEKQYATPTEGPNGVAIGYGLIFGSLGNTAEVFALRAGSGDEVWRIKLSNNDGIGIDMVPAVYDGVVYISTVPGTSENFYQGGQRGVLYAIDAQTGSVLWSFDTTTENLWGMPRINSGGGLWYPPSFDDAGNIYFGVGNAAPWPGTEQYPNASSRPGPNDYASSMVSLDRQTGAVRWYYNAKPHDLFDLDFQLTPVIATLSINGTDTKVAIGAGKTGTVVATNADTGDVLWEMRVGTHQNDDLKEIPDGQTVTVYPGPLGGVETPLAYADGTVYVPVVNLGVDYTTTGLSLDTFDYGKGTGELIAINVANGSVKWRSEVPTMLLGGAAVANDVVFTAGLDGTVRGFDTATGDQVLTYQAGAGINAPLAIAGDTLLVPAGGFLVTPSQSSTPQSAPAAPSNQLIALSLGGVVATPDIAGTPAAPVAPAGSPVATAPATATAPPAATTPPAPTDQSGSPTAASGSATQVTVEMVDIDFNPNEFTVPANTDVTVTLNNTGAGPHNFSIDKLGISVDVAPGATKTVTINAPAGSYTYYCNVPGHRAAGMVGTMTVQ